MSKHERSSKNKTVAFFKLPPPLLRQERVTHDLDKQMIQDNSPRVLSHDLFCRFASLQPGKKIDNTIQRKLKQGKL